MIYHRMSINAVNQKPCVCVWENTCVLHFTYKKNSEFESLHRCALLRLDTIVKRRSIACIMFIFDILSGRMNSPNMLPALDLNTPRYWTRGSEFLRIGFHRTNRCMSQCASLTRFDFNLTRNQFMNRLKLTL
jgi:hypothetical protein